MLGKRKESLISETVTNWMRVIDGIDKINEKIDFCSRMESYWNFSSLVYPSEPYHTPNLMKLDGVR